MGTNINSRNLGKLKMKIIGMITLLMMPFLCFANPAPFGLELGRMNVDEFKESHLAHFKGVNRYGGEMYDLSSKEIDFDGLRSAKVIFDKNGTLAAVSIKMDRSRFSPLFNILKSKYKLVKEQSPSVGDKSARFVSGGVQINIWVPHVGLEMEMEYITQNLVESVNNHVPNKSK